MIDIRFHLNGPAGGLSNMYPNTFFFDGVRCESMEGLLQAFKLRDEAKQAAMCAQSGYEAKLLGKTGDGWRSTQTLHWKGKVYDRDSIEYQKLLDRAYQALSENRGFQNALLETAGHTLTHRLGSTDPHYTVLTQAEFLTRLVQLRRVIQSRRAT